MRRTWRGALVNTQGGGLYAEVMPTFLHDRTADRPGIFEAPAAMECNMAKGAGQDLAVVMFSGHGTMIDGQFLSGALWGGQQNAGTSPIIFDTGDGVPEQNRKACRAWPGPGSARRLPLGWADRWKARRRLAEVGAGRQQRDGADIFKG